VAEDDRVASRLYARDEFTLRVALAAASARLDPIEITRSDVTPKQIWTGREVRV